MALMFSPESVAKKASGVQTKGCVPGGSVAAARAERPVRQVATLHRPEIEPLAPEVAEGEGLALSDRRGADGAFDLAMVVAHDGSEG